MMIGAAPRVLTRPTVLVFHDLDPTKNWGHACEYLLHDSTTGEVYETIPASLPPPPLMTSPETFQALPCASQDEGHRGVAALPAHLSTNARHRDVPFDIFDISLIHID